MIKKFNSFSIDDNNFERLKEIIDLIQRQENLKSPDFLPMVNQVTRNSKLQELLQNE